MLLIKTWKSELLLSAKSKEQHLRRLGKALGLDILRGQVVAMPQQEDFRKHMT